MNPPTAAASQAQYPTTKALEDERKRATFNVRNLTHFLDGSAEITAHKEQVMLELERDSDFKVSDYPDMSREQIRERSMIKVRKLTQYLTTDNMEQFLRRISIVSMLDPGTFTRFGVHFGLFYGAVSGQGTPAQIQYWNDQGAMNCKGLIGCFGMTELGHGSNVAGVETTATFDEDTDEFVINTPTVTATKWWIGGAASSATHCAVYAQLIVKGKNYGSKPFVVQLRDRETFALMPGVSIGDLGAKMGRDGIDNGWIQFTNVRIPRSWFLMKYTKVTRKGIVTSPPLAQLSYGALIQGRVQMIEDSANVSSKALTIAIRYANIRRQFSARPSEPETKLMDYVIHQHRLLPLLAQVFAFTFTGREVRKLYTKLMDRLNAFQPGENKAELNEIVEILKETHSTAAGLKAFTTWGCLNTIEQCRQTLGGHGYSKYSGLAVMYNDFAVQCTWEGDNTILMLQLGRYLISSYREAVGGKQLPGGLAYMNKRGPVSACEATTEQDFARSDYIQQAYDIVSLSTVKDSAEEFLSALNSGKKEDQAMEICSYTRLVAARNHCFGYLFKMFRSAFESAPADLRHILEPLLNLYGLYNIQENSGLFLANGYLTGKHLVLIRKRILFLYETIRPQTVALVDSFNLSDFVINSPMGRYDGNIYNSFYDQIKAANPPAEHKYFEKVIKPMVWNPKKVYEDLELEDES